MNNTMRNITQKHLKRNNNSVERRVMKEAYEVDFIGTIDESGAGIARVLKMLDDNKDFLMITASRGNKTRKENQKNNNNLISYIRKELGMKVGAYKLVGHWKECSEPLDDGETLADCKGGISDTLEESWLIIKPDDISGDLFRDIANKVAKKYNQDAYVIRKDGKLTLNSKNGDEWIDLGKANRSSLSTGFVRISGIQGYSELKKVRNSGRVQNIVFENIYLSVPKDTNFSKMIFKEMSILY